MDTKDSSLQKYMLMRPHHLLCTQGFAGKGYSEDFVRNMTYWVERLRGEKDFRVRIIFSTDDLCRFCPQKKGEGLCADDSKVLSFDRKVIEYFQLEEKEYVYQDLIREIDAKMTPEMLEDICGSCSWYQNSLCRRMILGHSRI